jgi:uncharacterized protein
MTMLEILNADMISAMKDKNKEVLAVVRMVKAAVQLEQINKQKELTDEDVIGIVAKQIKMRLDSIEEFKKGNRGDLIVQVESEIAILNKYLPEQLSDDELTNIIDEVFSIVNPTLSSDMGKIMKELMPKVKGKADMTKVNSIIKEKLENI